MLDPRHHARRRALARAFKVLATLIVVYFLILNIPGLRNAVDQLSEVKPGLLVLGLVLELLALFCYSLMTRAALGPVGHHMTALHLFRIQLSTRALSSLVPGGSAAGSALGYRMMVASGVPGPDAGFALATAGLASAVVFNFILWGRTHRFNSVAWCEPGVWNGGDCRNHFDGYCGCHHLWSD